MTKKRLSQIKLLLDRRFRDCPTSRPDKLLMACAELVGEIEYLAGRCNQMQDDLKRLIAKRRTQ